MHLTINMRILRQSQTISEVSDYNQNALQFANWLLKIGEGKQNNENKVDLLPCISSLLTSLIIN